MAERGDLLRARPCAALASGTVSDDSTSVWVRSRGVLGASASLAVASRAAPDGFASVAEPSEDAPDGLASVVEASGSILDRFASLAEGSGDISDVSATLAAAKSKVAHGSATVVMTPANILGAGFGEFERRRRLHHTALGPLCKRGQRATRAGDLTARGAPAKIHISDPMLPYNRKLKQPSRQLRSNMTEAEERLWGRCGDR